MDMDRDMDRDRVRDLKKDVSRFLIDLVDRIDGYGRRGERRRGSRREAVEDENEDEDEDDEWVNSCVCDHVWIGNFGGRGGQEGGVGLFPSVSQSVVNQSD